MILRWLFLAFVAWPAAGEILSLPRPATVYARPSPEAKVLTQLKAFTRVSVGTKDFGGFRKVRFKAGGKVRTGYILNDVFQMEEARREWGFAGGFFMSSLKQGGKSFVTEDEVTYKTTEYASSTFFPFISIQYGLHEGFWRLSGYMRTAAFSTTATTDVSSISQEVKVESRFLAGSLQRAWPLYSRYLYVGGGAELAKAISTSVKIAGQELTIPEGSEPVYFGIQGFLGAHFFISQNLSLHTEGQFLIIANQKPMILGFEALLGLYYWL